MLFGHRFFPLSWGKGQLKGLVNSSNLIVKISESQLEKFHRENSFDVECPYCGRCIAISGGAYVPTFREIKKFRNLTCPICKQKYDVSFNHPLVTILNEEYKGIDLQGAMFVFNFRLIGGEKVAQQTEKNL